MKDKAIIIATMGAALMSAMGERPIIKRRNHPSYDDMLAEYSRIQDKKSTLSRRDRDKLVAKVQALIKSGAIVMDENQQV